MNLREFGPTPAYETFMTRSVRFGLAFYVLAGFVAVPRAAQAQGADTLPPLDETNPVTAPEPLPPAPPPPITLVYAPTPKPSAATLGPIRAQRRLALLGEVGWNGIAGFGPNLTFHAHPHLSFDLGAGLSFLGWKTGLRVRYNILTGPVTPFIGVGVIGAGGLGDSPFPINDDTKNDTVPPRETVNIKVLPSAWLQTVGGVDWTAPGGFTLVGAVGWANLLSHDPVEVLSGEPNSEERQAMDVLFRSGIVITTAIGYSFR